MSDKVYLGQRVSNLDIGEPSARISRVNLLVDSRHMYTAGDDSGRTIEKTILWGTQAMADYILSALRGADYRPYSGQEGLLDPAAEVGDGITVGGVYSILAQTDILFDALCTADVSAPGGDEAEDEYPYKSRARRQMDRELAQVRSSIRKTANEITLLLEDTAKGISAKFSVELEKISSTVTGLDGKISAVEQTAEQISSKVTGLDGKITTITQDAEKIVQRVESAEGSISTTLDLINGWTVTDSSGTTKIKGSIIETGSLNLTGQITFSDLNSSTQSSINAAASNASAALTNASSALANANSAYSMASSAQSTVNGWVYPGTTMINGYMIMTGTVQASLLRGGIIQLLDQNGLVAGQFTVTGASSWPGSKVFMESGALEFKSWNGDIFMSTDSTTLHLYSGIVPAYPSGYTQNSALSIDGNTFPMRDNWFWLGTPAYRWQEIYAVNSMVQTSDREKKKDITYSLEEYNTLFDALRPCWFRFKENTHERKHLGLISQDVEAALEASGLTAMDFAGFIRSPKEGKEDEYDYALRYGEFIALCIEQIQKLKARVAELERRFSA